MKLLQNRDVMLNTFKLMIESDIEEVKVELNETNARIQNCILSKRAIFASAPCKSHFSFINN